MDAQQHLLGMDDWEVKLGDAATLQPAQPLAHEAIADGYRRSLLRQQEQAGRQRRSSVVS